MSASLYSNIPEELRLLPNWVLWKYVQEEGASKPTKVPYHPKGFQIGPKDPSHWVTFEVAFNTFQLGGYEGLGFVFTNTIYSGIDLDDPTFLKDGVTPNPNYQIDLDRQIKIAHEFNSYSELSPSSKGLHIIVKGSVPSGKRRSYIEVYSENRYFTMTGKVHNNAPITEQQALLSRLWSQLLGDEKTQTVVQETEETESDEVIITKATDALNGDKFHKLHSGEWQDLYSSQSEADFAYIDMVAFYTQNRNQIIRIFRSSALGKRPKAKRADYVNDMITRSFDRIAPNIDFDKLKSQMEIKLSENKTNSVYDTLAQSPITPPPGLIGEIAQFIYEASPRPVPEISIAAAIGMMAGICGKAYNISGTGLNMYLLILASTGKGKEAAALGIDKLMNAIRPQVPTSSRFVGPGIINSGQALIKHLHHTSDCFLSVLGEFGIMIERISSPLANSAEKALYSNLLDLYNKSGYGQSVKSSIYSKKEENTSDTPNPAVSILGESTHKLFYKSLNEDMIAAGLLPRFLIIEYNGKREYMNKGSIISQPSFSLVERLAGLVAHCETIIHGNTVINVPYNSDAEKMLDALDRKSTDYINSSPDDVVAELWNRAHMKVLRLSALLAIGENAYSPMITTDNVKWATDLVERDIKLLSARFAAGEIGKHTGEAKQISEILRMVRDFYRRDYSYLKKYLKLQDFHDKKVMPLTYFSSRLSGLAVFNDGRVKSSIAINQVLSTLCERDILEEVPKRQLVKDFGTTQRCYVLKDNDVLLNPN